MSEERRGNLGALAATRAVLAVSGLVVNVALARALSREDFATYRWIASVMALGAFGAHLGLWQLMTRRVVAEADAARRLVPLALRATLVSAGLTGVLLAAYVAVRDPRPEVAVAGVLAAITLGITAGQLQVQAAFHGLRRMRWEVPGVLVGRVVLVVSQLALLAVGAGLAALYAGRLLAAVVLLAALLWTFRRRVGRFEAAAPGETVGAWLAEGRHYGATVLFAAVAAQADIVMLDALSTRDELARYAAPASVLLQLAFVATILSRGFFPKVAAAGGDAPRVSELLGFQSRMLLLVAAPVAAGGVVVAGPLMVLLFSQTYADAGAVAAVLLIAVPVRFVNAGHGLALTALDRHRERARLDAIGAAVNVTANLLAIPWLGAVGAAGTTLATDLVLAVLFRRELGPAAPGYRLLGPVARTVAPAVAMAVLVALVPGLPVLARVVLGVLVYPPLAWLSGAWRPGDRARLQGV